MQKETLTEKVIEKQPVVKGRIVDVEKWTVELPNGRTAQRDIVLHKGAAAVVPLDNRGRVAMVRQYRTPIGRVMLEIPAGKLDTAQEDPFLCAQRELREETGLTASSWRKLTVIHTTPGFCNEAIHLYLAQGLTQGDGDLDEDEFIHVQWFPLEDLIASILRGEIADSKTLVALLMVDELLRKS